MLLFQTRSTLLRQPPHLYFKSFNKLVNIVFINKQFFPNVATYSQIRYKDNYGHIVLLAQIDGLQ